MEGSEILEQASTLKPQERFLMLLPGRNSRGGWGDQCFFRLTMKKRSFSPAVKIHLPKYLKYTIHILEF